jgi:hypothetical protein
MQKSIILLLVTLLIPSCTTYRFFYPGGQSGESGLAATDTAGVSTLLLQNDLNIEYLDGHKTEFHKAGTVLIHSGERTLTMRLENSLVITEYFPFTREFREGETLCLGYELINGEKEVLLFIAEYNPVTKSPDSREILVRKPLIHKSRNEKEPVIIP